MSQETAPGHESAGNQVKRHYSGELLVSLFQSRAVAADRVRQLNKIANERRAELLAELVGPDNVPLYPLDGALLEVPGGLEALSLRQNLVESHLGYARTQQVRSDQQFAAIYLEHYVSRPARVGARPAAELEPIRLAGHQPSRLPIRQVEGLLYSRRAETVGPLDLWVLAPAELYIINVIGERSLAPLVSVTMLDVDAASANARPADAPTGE